MPYSAPDVPMITLSPITSGAIVSVYPAAGPSPTFTSHFTLPVVASRATRLSSSVPRNTDPPETATPRLLGPQQAVATGSFLCVYSHNIFCVRKSNARTMLLGVAGEVMYMTPATTIGVVSKLPSRSDPCVYTARGTRFLTFVVNLVPRAVYTHGSERRSEEHTSELQSLAYLVCRLLLEKKK